MTKLSWDHTVHYVNDLEQPISTFKENGLVAYHGGSHIEWGTYNALSYFGLTYIEFLSIENRELIQQTEEYHVVVKEALTYLPKHEAFSRVAIRTDNIDETATALKANGLELSPIMDSKRVNAQGELVEWRMMTIKGSFQGLPYPFVIQWMGTDDERLEKLTKSGTIQTHPSGQTTIQDAVFYVSNPLSVAQHWGKLFGLPVTELSEGTVSLPIGDAGQRFLFKTGEFNGLKQLDFQTESSALKGKTIMIGDAEYQFS